MRSKSYGLGKPSTGQYDIVDDYAINYDDLGAWKAFGAQGQYATDWVNDKSSMGFRPYTSEPCESRYVMVTVVHKAERGLSDDSEIVLDIMITELVVGATYLRSVVGIMSLALISLI